jgi:hypothetical protein
MSELRDDSWVPDDTFGARLALVRQRMRWNVAQAERECGFGEGVWRTWEAGRRPQNMDEVVRSIVARTSADRDWLMWGGPLRQNSVILPA